MKNFGIVVNIEKDKNLEVTRYLSQIISEKGGVVIYDDKSIDPSAPHGMDNILNNADMVFSVGGDGTLLRAARMCSDRGIPILGINLGRLGFLTQVDRGEIDNSIERIFKGDFVIEERIMLSTIIHDEDGNTIAKDVALNDIAITREHLSRLLDLKLYINNEYVDTVPGDGIIVATPTGSTAYSMSAGGPLVDPDLDVMIITPICPHLLYSKSLVTSGNKCVRITIPQKVGYDATVSIDGQIHHKLSSGYYIDCYKSNINVKFIKMSNKNYFYTLRRKIFERGESLLNDEI